MCGHFYFGSNFKMHQTPAQTAAFVTALRERIGSPPDTQLFLIPPFTSLATAAQILAEGASDDTPIWLGAQTMHWADEGAHTGEISASMLAACGANLVMLGHAERRTHYGETDVMLRCKVRAAVRHSLRSLLCVGEDGEQRAANISAETVAMQLKIALCDLPVNALRQAMIAYEPVWSIGEGGTPADPAIVAEMLALIRRTLLDLFGPAAAEVPILYGGSVNVDNCAAYAALPQVDGLFVGRAAWTPTGFQNVLNQSLFARKDRRG